MNFRLSAGIYNTDERKTVTLVLLVFLIPLIAGPVYVIWKIINQADELGTAEKVGRYFYYLYSEQQILLIPFVIIACILPLLFFSEKSRSSAYIKIERKGFEYNLPLVVRDISNGFSAIRRVVLWDNVLCVRVFLGERSRSRFGKGPPSSRLLSSKIAIIGRDFQVILNPYCCLPEGHSDHRLSRQEASSGLDEDAVRSIFEQCPMMVALDSLKNVKLEKMPLGTNRAFKIDRNLSLVSKILLFLLFVMVIFMMVFSR